MSYGFQILILLPNNRRMTGEAPCVWTLPPPVGEIRIVSFGNAPTFDESTEITIYGSSYKTATDAQQSGETLSSWLRVTSAIRTLGFDLGNGRQLSFLSEEGAKMFGVNLTDSGQFLVPDIQGLTVFQELGKPARFSMRASGRVLQNTDLILENLQKIAASVSEIPENIAIACDLLSVAEHVLTDEAKFLTYVYAMESLIKPSERSHDVVTWINEAVIRINSDDNWEDINDRDSFANGLQNLKNRSYRSELKALAARVRPNDSEALSIVDEAYSRRSGLVHPNRARKSVDHLLGKVLLLVQDEIRYLLDLDVS
jgi:hypothetical protein